MSILILHNRRSALSVPSSQLFDLGRSSKKFFILSNIYTHLPLEKTKAKYQVDSVEDAIFYYKIHLHSKLFYYREKSYQNSIDFLVQQFLKLDSEGKDMYLSCWCKDDLKPNSKDHGCHCDIVRDILLKKVARQNEI